MVNKKSQSWSIDIIVAVVVFMGAFFLFYTILNSNPNTKASSLKQDASSVIKQIAAEDSSLRVIDNNEVNESRLNELKNLSYDELKRQFRVEGDFCIYMEDDKGNIVLINNSYKGVGTPSIMVGGTPCSQQ